MSNYIKYLPLFVGLTLLQFVFQNNFILFNYAFCFVYVGFILLLPINTPPILYLFFAFISGISIDIFGNTLGINAFSTVFIAFLRGPILKIIEPRGGYDQDFSLNIKSVGIVWMIAYFSILIFIHHLLLFMLEASSFQFFFSSILKTISSTALTLLILILGMLLFSSKSK